MESNPDLAKGYTRREKTLVESLWEELAGALNAAGPPSKQVAGWKKVWAEWKSEIKKKLAHNKSEGQATGGGPFSKYHLTNTEEVIVRLCGISRAVDGVRGIAVGVGEDADETDEDLPSTSSKRQTDTPLLSKTPKRAKVENMTMRLNKFLDEDNENKKEIKEKLNEILIVGKENGSSFRRIYRAIEKSNESIAEAIHQFRNEFQETTLRMLSVLQEKNDLKKQQIQLETEKLQLRKQRAKDYY